MKKTSLVLVAALFAAATVNAGSGMGSSGSSTRSPSPAPARMSSPPPAPAQRSAPAPAPRPAPPPAPVAQKAISPAPAPTTSSVSKSGFSGGSGTAQAIQAPKVQAIAPQGATAQALVRESGKAAAVAAFAHVEQQKADKARAEKASAEMAAATSRREAQAASTRTQATSPPVSAGAGVPQGYTPPRERVIIVERERTNDSDYWRGVAIGQSMNRPPQVIHQQQPSAETVGRVTPPTNSSPRYTPATSNESSGSLWWSMFWTLVFIGLVAGSVFYFVRRQKQAEVARLHKPTYQL